MPSDDANPAPRPEGHPASLPWPPALREYPAGHPARRDEESKQAFNEDWARADFGDEFVEKLKRKQHRFAGDWWMLALLVRCAEVAAKQDPKGEDPNRLATFNYLSPNPFRDAVIHLEHADLNSAHLEHARLSWGHLEHAKLTSAHFEHAYLFTAHLEDAMLSKAHFEHANLFLVHLEHAILTEAVFSGADLRAVSGLRFDANRVRDIHIEGNAPDPWSVLRRSYSGPWFFLHAALLVAFILPYVGKVLALTAADHAGRVYEQFAPQIPSITIERIPAWKVLIGLDKAWWVPALAGVLLVYNLIRGVLTLKVGMLRDAEERSGITPKLAQYMGTQALNNESLTGALARLARDLFKWLARRKIDEHKRASFERLGLWRLHRLLTLLFWIAILSFTFHAAHWVWTTTLPHVEVGAGAPGLPGTLE